MTNPNDRITQPRQGGRAGDGLTKREYFAAMAQAAIIAGLYGNPDPTNVLKREMTDVAKEACKHADALMAELKK